MKNKKPVHIRFSYFNNEKIEQKLRGMAEQGWILTAERHGMWKRLIYVRDTPRQLHYSIIPSPNLNQDAQELDDLCAQAGWELLAVKRRFRIYVNAQQAPVPIYTDPQDSADRYGQLIRRRIIWIGALEVLAYVTFLIYYIGLFSDYKPLAPHGILDVPSNHAMLMAFLYLVIIFLCYLAAVLIPLWRARRALRKNREDWPKKVRRSEISSRWIQIIAPVILISSAFLACTDAIDLPYQHGEPPLTAIDMGYDGEIRWDYMTWDGPFCSFKRYLSLTPEYVWGVDEFFYVSVEMRSGEFFDQIARKSITESGGTWGEPNFTQDGIDVYYVSPWDGIYLFKDTCAVYISGLKISITTPEVFEQLKQAFFIENNL